MSPAAVSVLITSPVCKVFGYGNGLSADRRGNAATMLMIESNKNNHLFGNIKSEMTLHGSTQSSTNGQIMDLALGRSKCSNVQRTPSKSFNPIYLQSQKIISKAQMPPKDYRTPPLSPISKKRPRNIEMVALTADTVKVEQNDMKCEQKISTNQSWTEQLSRSESSDSGFGSSESSNCSFDVSMPSLVVNSELGSSALKLAKCNWVACNNRFHSDDGQLLDHTLASHVSVVKPCSPVKTRSRQRPEYSEKRFACQWTGCKLFDQAPQRGDPLKRFHWLEGHVRERHAGRAKPYACIMGHCKIRFCSQSALNTHLANGHNNDNKKSKTEAKSDCCKLPIMRRKKKIEPILYHIPPVDDKMDFFDEASVAVMVERIHNIDTFVNWHFEQIRPKRQNNRTRRKVWGITLNKIASGKKNKARETCGHLSLKDVASLVQELKISRKRRLK